MAKENRMPDTQVQSVPDTEVEGTIVPEQQERVVPVNQERVTPSWLQGKAPSIEEERAAVAAPAEKPTKTSRKPSTKAKATTKSAKAAKPAVQAAPVVVPTPAPTGTGRKMVLDAYLNAKTQTVTVYDRYVPFKKEGNRGHFTIPEFEAFEAQKTGEGWRVHRVKWESAVARAEKRDAAKPKTFTVDQLTEFLAANPRITLRKAVEQLSQ